MSTWIESVTQLLAKLLTDKETEHVIHRLTTIQKQLKKQPTVSISNSCKHEMSCFIHAFRGLSRTFVISFLVKHAIYVLPLLRKGFGNIFKFKLDTVKFALFLSSYVSLYRIVLCNLTKYTNLKPRAFIAGFVASISIVLDSNEKRRNGIVWFVCARSLYAAVKLGFFKMQVKEEPTFELFESPPPTPIPHKLSKDKLIDFCNAYGNTFFMAGSCSIILYNIVFHPFKLPKSYRNFLFYVCRVQDRFQHDGIKMMNLLSYNCKNNISNCQVMHPNRSCEYHYPIYFTQVFLRCMQIYSPLSLATTLIFKFKMVKKNLSYAIKFSLKSAIRSSVFLAALSTTTFATACILRRIRQREDRWHYMINGFLAGCCIFIEPYGRRTELALYMLPRTLETIFPHINKVTEMFLLCWSTGIMMHVYEVDHSLLGTQGKIMTRIFGVT